MPELNFHVEAASVVSHAIAPTLAFKLRIENPGGEEICSIMLKTQIQITPILRHYNAHEQERLFELYGPPAHWANSLKTLLLANTVELVPAFNGSTVIDLSLPCTYDFEVASSKFFHGVEEGEVPLEFLFSGSLFYVGETGLQIDPGESDGAAPETEGRAVFGGNFPAFTRLPSAPCSRSGPGESDRPGAHAAST